MSSLIQSNQVIIQASMTNAGQTLSANDSGKTIILPAATGAGTLTLPPVQAGLRYRIIMSATAAQIITIRPTAGNTVQGVLLVNNAGTTNTIAKNAANSVQFTATAVAGDSIELTSDGTLYYVTGSSAVAAGLA